MLKKDKPMMTVAAIIEQAQSRWMDQHTIQVLNRFQGSYCNYFLSLTETKKSHPNVIVSIVTYSKSLAFVVVKVFDLLSHSLSLYVIQQQSHSSKNSVNESKIEQVSVICGEEQRAQGARRRGEKKRE